jgi:hypothetical protein
MFLPDINVEIREKKMPEDIDEILQALNQQQGNSNSEQTIEQLLMNLLLNPVKLKRQRIRIEENLNNGVLYELREGTIINEAGCLEEIEEIVINPQTFADGSPMNIYGIAKCPSCGSLVQEENLFSCACCGGTVCISQGCLYYSRFTGNAYCSKLHKYLHILRINLR